MNKPSGTVAFLFTDIEGSTKLAQNFSEDLHETLEKHNSILNNAVESNNGFVFKTVGDAFCCAFQNTEDAVNAAVDAQKKLNSENWNEAVLKVRMGIHIGNAEWSGKDYMGYVTLARSARIMSVAYGGQIIISDNAFEVAKEKTDAQITYRDLGERRLKDLIQPMKLYQIVTSELPADFPPLKTLDARPNNLPVQLTNFIGRENEIPEVKKALANTRLLTLTGTGGTGKTRLSMQIAADMIDEFANGVWITELAPLTDPALINLKITEALGVNVSGDQSGDNESTLFNYLKEKELLLILDNCEHLIHGCAEITEKLLRYCPKLKIIATSREALRCEGEITFKVASLAHPEPKHINTPEELTQFESVRLFIERALAVNSNFRVTNENAPALAQICYQLDGIPLAIELAAARIKILPLEKICEKLDDRFRFLTGGTRTALPRQQTLKALINWSYDLLTEKEKILFQRLSVFSGGWYLEAAEEICSGNGIDIYDIIDLHTHLLDKSLISTTEKSGQMRFHLLESIKQYATEKLDSGEELKKKHLIYFKQIAEQTQIQSNTIDQRQWVKQIDTEVDNVRAAIQRALEIEPESACDIVNHLTDYWNLKGNFREGLQTCRKILDSNLEISEVHRANTFYNAGIMSYYIGNLIDAEKLETEGISLFRKLGENTGISKCLNALGAISATHPSNIEKTKAYYAEALKLAKEANDDSVLANTLYNLSFIAITEGDSELALNYRLESLDLYRKLKNTHQISMSLSSLAVFEYKRMNYEKALYYNQESLAISTELDDKYLISINLINLGNIYKGQKDYVNAYRLYNESMTILREYSYKSNLIVALMYLGEILIIKSEFKKAIDLHKESIQIGNESGNEYFLATNLFHLGSAYFGINDYETSLKYYLFVKTLTDGLFNPISKNDLTIAEERRIKIREILGIEKFESIQNEALKLSKEEIVEFVLSS